MGLDDRRKAANRKTYQQLMLDMCGLGGVVDRPRFAVPAASRRRADDFMRQSALAGYDAVVGLNTGGGGRWAQKKWTFEGYEGFLALTRARHPETAIVLLGGPAEAELNARLVASGREGVVDGGCTNSFADFAALVAVLDLLVTSDSLGLHTALAVDTPVVVFVGPTAPWELELYGDGASVHAPDLPCLACYRSACDKPVTCMERLDPEAVLEKVDAVLNP
jgi:heptosyltransferase-2